LLDSAIDVLRHPIRSAYWKVGLRWPERLWDRMSRDAAALGLRRLRVVLSFDCDTDRDIAVAETVHERLAMLGVTPAYAVPGELLARGVEVYGKIAAGGAEFLNHGYTQHCVYDEAAHTYVSSFFYDQLPRATVAEDIERGHAAVVRRLGRAPRGFRVPHFGTFQSRGEIAWLHRHLATLGYDYSSSTVPLYGFRQGPAKRIQPDGAPPLWELPVTGRYSRPLEILDSWGMRYAPDRTAREGDYLREVRRFVDRFADRPMLLNIYADPSQIHDSDEFFEAMAMLSPFACRGFAELIAELRP
jgi:peptidoglycan/xylan/chitin deacetylase (PgdA/CDA1 family)